MRCDFVVSLRFQNHKLDPVEITKQLNLDPNRQWAAGDPVKRSPNRHTHSYWAHRFVHFDGVLLEDCLHALCDLLDPHKDFFEEIVSKKGRIEFFIGLFPEKTFGGILDWRLMEKLARLKIDLSFDGYAKDPNKKGEY